MSGGVLIRIEGLMLERLINRALNEGVQFVRLRRDGTRIILAETDAAGAKILTGLCERFSISFDVLNDRSRAALMRRLKRRATLQLGVLFGFFLLALMLSRVWRIDVVPAAGQALNAAPVQQRLTELGVRPGMSKAGLDVAQLERELAASAEEYSFVGARLQGVRLLIEVAPAIAAPEVYEIDGARDLVAECDGVILSVNVRSGIACVAPGDTVVRGQTLIRGEEKITKEETRPIAALGEVIARTWTEGEASAPLIRTGLRRTGRSSVSSELRLMQFAWPLTEGEQYASQEIFQEILPIGGLFLPLEIQRTTVYETEAVPIPADEAALERALTRLAFAQAHAGRTFPDGEAVDRWTEITRDESGNLRVRAVIEWNHDVAITRDGLYRQEGAHIGND